MTNEERGQLLAAMRERHSVRRYLDTPISAEDRTALQREIDACNAEAGVHLQLVTDEPLAFGGLMARYGKFNGVRNYIACAGPKGPQLEEKLGYYGEQLVLLAQSRGLNSCWVALTYSKGKCACQLAPGERLVCVIALGHGATQGTGHKSKSAQEVSSAPADAPQWFTSGVEAALLAPTALNQQKFMLTLEGARVRAEATGGPYSKIDLGIVKRHFELGSGKTPAIWL
ncbi:MAG: nitroreductase family protein [Coriobacteriales bacterium]